MKKKPIDTGKKGAFRTGRDFLIFAFLFPYPTFVSIVAFLIMVSVSTRADEPSASDYVWIEGETPTSIEPAGVQPKIQAASPLIGSSSKVLVFSLEPNQADTMVPNSGIILSYAAKVSKATDYDIWIHVGFEQVRCTFDWRFDDGDWQTVDPQTPTVDVQELGIWEPFAWLNMGKQTLTAGNHTLQLRLDKGTGKNGKMENFLFGVDAFCLAPGPFHPDGSIKPGDTSWQTDADKSAAAQVFDVPVPTGATQASTLLKGLWQYAGDDELLVDDRLGPVKSIPDANTLTWHGLPVPGDRNKLMPTEQYVHRFYLRTRVNIPAALAGHSFVLHVPAENMIATVFVNGQPCGWTKAPWAVWDCDITGAVKPGQVNEIWVVFKDIFYACAGKDMAKHPRYTPYSFWHYNMGPQLDMPVLGNKEAGFLLNGPSLIVGGPVYTADVFAIPSVRQKTLGLEITLHNPTSAPLTVHLTNEVDPLAGGAAEKTFAPQDVTVPAGQDSVVKISEPWPNPKLWWQDDPQQYNVVTRLSVDGRPVDERATKFGFREWTWDGANFKLNGVPWHGYADETPGDLAALLGRGQFMIRVWVWNPSEENGEFLDQCDAAGMNVRRTGIFNGEGVDGFYDLTRNDLWDNYRTQIAAWVKGQRNHPSIFIWSMENEITFINGRVCGQNAITTREMKKTADLVMQIDPTRPIMPDGGNAELDESLPVYGGHYMEPKLNSLPEGAYDIEAMQHRQVWPVTLDKDDKPIKPILLGESAFIAGESNADHATIGGEQAFLGRAEARPAVAEELRMLSEGYRWNDINFHFWTENQIPTYYKAWSPVAVLCRQWDLTFGSGENVTRTLGIFNNTHDDDPITLGWNLTVDGRKIASDSSVHQVPAGGNEKFDMTLPMPAVTSRQDGVWTLTLSRKGTTVFEEARNISVLPPAGMTANGGETPAAGRVALYDPNGGTKDFFSKIGLPFTNLADLTQIPDTAKVLVIGKDALDPATSVSSQFAAWASQGQGRAVIVLEQQNQLKFQALPGQMKTDTNHGCLGFPEDITSPIFAGLKAGDFYCWGPDDFLYRNAYVKPINGGKSLLQCDTHLEDTALVQMQAGPGILLLSQLLIGEKLATNPVARQLLLNMVRYGNDYQLTFRPAVVAAADNPQLMKAIDTMGLKYTSAANPLSAIEKAGSIAIVNASAANLKTLASNLPMVKAFTEGGGWLVLNNLGPDGLADYNTLVGVNHLIRPFKKEKVTWPLERNPLTAGLSASNIVIGSGKQIVTFQAGEWPDPDAYSYVVDLDDVAPFATSPFGNWDNIINNYTMADGAWQLIINLPADQAVVPITLARPEKILQFTWVSDLNYEGATKIQLEINGKSYIFDTVPNGDPQTFDLPDQPTTDKITLKVVGWEHNPQKDQNGKELVGIDNIYIKVARAADFAQKVKPLLNIGAMVEYPQGQGGIILCNVKFKDSEQNPVNVGKKQAILSNLLHNLTAPFTNDKAIIAGSNLAFTPIDISQQANQYRGAQGWFGDNQHAFDALPDGKQVMAGVTYDIYHFSTSPVPEAIMLGGRGIPGNLPDHVRGIPVNAKADALFFLEAARIDQPLNDDDKRENKKYEIADYLIHYADGQTVTVPIYSEISVAGYHQTAPTAIPGAQIAWSTAYPEANSYAVAYSQQWNNPRPDVEISSIDLVAGPQKNHGVPAVLAISAATTQ